VRTETSFTAKKGVLSVDPTQNLKIDQPVNNKDGAVYTFTFYEDSMVPQDGFIQIDIPNDIKFNAS
jgi:hypothetical protein